MSYSINEGIPETALKAWLSSASKKYGTFKDGRVNYKHANKAPIVMCTVVCGSEMLLAKRGYGLADAEGYWSTINGFIDEIKPVKKVAQQELREELDIDVDLKDIKVGKSYTLENTEEKRQYIVFPCLVTLKNKPKIKLDKEHTDYAWILRSNLEIYDILADLPYAVDAALAVQ